MSSGGDKTTTETKQSGPPEWAIPYYQANLGNISNFVNQPYTMNPYASNAYSDDMVKQLEGDITKQYKEGTAPSLMAQFNSSGAYGGSAHQQALQSSQQAFANQLAAASTGIRAQDADAQREAWYQMMNEPYKRYGLLNDALRSIMGGSESVTGPNPNYTSAAQNASAYASLIAALF